MKNVVITGAGRGIGLALAKLYSENGFKVLGTYRKEDSAKDFLAFAKESKNVIAVTADVTDANSFSALQAEIKKMGTVDILINNSGIIGDKESSLLKFDIEKSLEVFQVNTLGPMRITKLIAPFMNNGGTIAHISSMMGSIQDNSSGGYYDYRMSKAALNMFNSCLAKEFKNLTCLVLHPGWVQTDMGGAGASVKVSESASGLYDVILKASLQQTGQFIDFRGKHLPW